MVRTVALEVSAKVNEGLCAPRAPRIRTSRSPRIGVEDQPCGKRSRGIAVPAWLVSHREVHTSQRVVQSGVRLIALSCVLLLLCGASAHAADPATRPSSAAPADVAAPPLDAQKTATGLAMKVVTRGTGKLHPNPNDCVRVRYAAWTRSGERAGASTDEEGGELACLRGMTPGLAEAVAKMVVGEQRRLWVPEALAFPVDPNDDDQPRRKADLTYDLTLLTILAAPPTPRALKQASPKARKLPSGVTIEIERRGPGQAHPDPSQQLTMHLSCWTTDGALHESTKFGGKPLSYRIAELVPGLAEALKQLVVGDVARVWVPAALAYGSKPRRRSQPAGNLVYDVELVGLE
jgi:FKBP-type peptidyl-prolyl cis-trans isomerase